MSLGIMPHQAQECKTCRQIFRFDTLYGSQVDLHYQDLYCVLHYVEVASTRGNSR
jgi:hypothetical protein